MRIVSNICTVQTYHARAQIISHLGCKQFMKLAKDNVRVYKSCEMGVFEDTLVSVVLAGLMYVTDNSLKYISCQKVLRRKLRTYPI